jgi:hypothetical protein
MKAWLDEEVEKAEPSHSLSRTMISFDTLYELLRKTKMEIEKEAENEIENENKGSKKINLSSLADVERHFKRMNLDLIKLKLEIDSLSSIKEKELKLE